MNGVTIRRATPADKEEWLHMRRTLWPDEDAGELRSSMDAILADPLTPVFLAIRPDGSPGGFVEAGTRKYAENCNTSPVGYIEGWYVDADLRRQGVGTALIRAAEDWARSQGLTEMGSDTWLDDEASIRAHSKLGYRETERLVHFLKQL